MGAEATLRPDSFPVSPGGEAHAEISVKNTGRVVDSFELSVLGEAAAWSACEPAVLSLFPGQSATASLIVAPPFGSRVPHGPLPFAVRVSSGEDPAGSVVEEGVLDVAPMPLVTAELSPRTGRARGMRASRHKVIVANHGNAPASVDLIGGDDADTVYVRVSPSQLVVAGGGALAAMVRVRARRRLWRGPSETHPFFVVASPLGGQAERCDATMIQRAVIPAWLPRTLALVAAGAAVLVGLWFALVRPLVTNTAQNAANTAVSRHAATAGGGKSEGGAAQQGGAGGAGGGSKSPSPSPSPAVKPVPKPVPSRKPVPPPAPFQDVLSAGSPALAPLTGRSLGITDMLFQNPGGDEGLLTVKLDGQTVYAEQLADYPEYDAHWETPLVVKAGQQLTFSVACADKGGAKCSATVLVTGMSAAS